MSMSKLNKLLNGLNRRGIAIVNKLERTMRGETNNILLTIYSKLGKLINNIQPPTTSEAFHSMLSKSQQEIMTLVESFINKINNTTLPPGVDLQKDIQDLRNFFTKGDTASPGDTSAALLSTITSFPTGPSSTAAVLSAIASFPTGPSLRTTRTTSRDAANLSTMAGLSGQPSTGSFPTGAAIESPIKSFGGPIDTAFRVDPSIPIRSAAQDYAANLSTVAAFDKARAMAGLSGQPSVVYRPTGAAIDTPTKSFGGPSIEINKSRATGPSSQEQMYANLSTVAASRTVVSSSLPTAARNGPLDINGIKQMVSDMNQRIINEVININNTLLSNINRGVNTFLASQPPQTRPPKLFERFDPVMFKRENVRNLAGYIHGLFPSPLYPSDFKNSAINTLNSIPVMIDTTILQSPGFILSNFTMFLTGLNNTLNNTRKLYIDFISNVYSNFIKSTANRPDIKLNSIDEMNAAINASFDRIMQSFEPLMNGLGLNPAVVLKKYGGYRRRPSHKGHRSHKGHKGRRSHKGSKGRRSHKGHKGSKNKTHKGRKH